MINRVAYLRATAFLLAAATSVLGMDRTAVAAETVTLSGRVVGPNNQPIGDVGVVIAAVTPRDGEPLLSRYSHADCLKHAFTDADGRFEIPGLASDVKFTVVIATAGLKRALLQNVIPEKNPLEVKLAPTKLKLVRSPANDVRGQVLLPDGSPAAGAIIVPRGYMQGDTGLEGPMDQVAESTVADREGRFRISSAERITALHLEVAARGTVRQYFMDTPAGAYEQQLQLVKGVTARGRVMQNGKPVAGIVVGAIWTKHVSGCWFGPWDTTTDAEGRFTLENLTPNEDLCVFGRMKSLGERGVLAAVPLRGGDGEEIDLGELNIEPGFELHGWLQMIDGATLPEHTRVKVTREFTWDDLEVEARADGYFEFKCLPPELINLYVGQRSPGAKYLEFNVRMTQDNLSWNPTRDSQLHGLIESDRQINIALENKPPVLPNLSPTAAESQRLAAIVEKLERSPLRGLPGSADP